ncbi:MAG: ribose-phosphate pyrophosphokinase-like domain-containing protein, partial [Lachnospiraceae bacterium]|nr:ribose-phosphate pyrophosphokinase-like domain-containing protein [Candidatus Equihabitans merdae]
MTPPDGRLGIIVLDSISALGQKVSNYLSDWRTERVIAGTIQNYNGYARPDYLIPVSLPRFTSGEAKGEVKQTIRGDDIYIMLDVCNYGMTYKMSGFENVMSPDDHYQDLKRVIGAIGHKANRINVIMPYLYEARQELRDGRESLD